MKDLVKKLLVPVMFLLLSCGDKTGEDGRPAQVETLNAENITDISAICRGRITDAGTGTVSQYGIELDDGNGYKRYPRTGSTASGFHVVFPDLKPDHQYRYRAFIDDGTLSHGAEKSFSTLLSALFEATIDPAKTSSSSAVISFTLTDRLKEWGVHYSEGEQVGTHDPVKREFSRAEVTLGELKPNTTYSLMPYVKDKKEEKTTYLDIVSFTTRKATYSNPVIRSDAPDPTVIHAEDGYFYLYHTGVGIHRSEDLVNWRYIRDAFTAAGRPNWEPDGGLWAPDINYINGKYVMFYSMSVWGGEWTCGIGVATSDKPEGPFNDRGKLFRSNEIGVQNSIDPAYIEDNGKKYLFWGSFRGIYAIELTDDGLNLKPGAEKQQVAGTWFEAVYIHKRNNYYYMFASIGSCCSGLSSTYETVVGRAQSILGPYINKAGGTMMNNRFERVISGNNLFKGTGHNSQLIQDKNGDDWILYHAYQVANPDRGRQALMDKITWENDWPSVKNGTPSSSDEAPEF